MKHRLLRSRTDRILGGVCGGLADYLAIDVSLIRLFFVLLALGDGIGLLLYMVLWVVVPAEEAQEEELGQRVTRTADEIGQRAGELASDVQGMATQPRGPALQWVGAALLILGGYYLLRNLGFEWLWWLDFDVIWPVLLIVAGIVVLLRRGSKNE